MQTRFALVVSLCKAVALSVCLALPWPTSAALESGDYQSVADATVEERGDRVPNGSRIVPLFATFTLDLDNNQPSLRAVLTNAVLEGGDPFVLTVRSSSGTQLMDGSYRLMGDYLRDIYPSGTQYGFDWRFSSTNGEVVWNGAIGWLGGHYWSVAISNITLVPVARIQITRVGTNSVEISWATNFTNHVLECAAILPSTDWRSVTNAVTDSGDRLSVIVDANAAPGFYRLRKRNL
jgi:hypothetical protein